uniref:Uncharacterized protein n=1 Tax=Caenorhabditis japonica TaxID=281687 RepID=A0A8R1IJL4_CAEJA
MDQLKFISEDQNSNEREQTVERVEGLIKHWFNREEHIQVKQYELVDAIKGHPADNELRYGIQYLMEKFLSLNIEIDGTTGVSPSCLRYRVYSNLQDIDKLNKMKIPMAKCYAKYKKLAEEMRTFLVKFKPTHNIPPEKRIYL